MLLGPSGKALQHQGQTSVLSGWGPSPEEGDDSYQGSLITIERGPTT